MRTPKEQFLANTARAKQHQELTASPEYEQLINLALLHYTGTLEYHNNPQLMIVNEAKRQGSLEFVKVLSRFGSQDLKPIRKTEGQLLDPDFKTQ